MNKVYDSGYGTYTVADIAHHRNGVGGAGFVVSIIDHDGHKGEGAGRFVTTSFYPDCDEMQTADERRRGFIERTSALRIDLLPNIGFAEGNSWRGSDMFGQGVADAWYERCQNSEFGPYDPFEA